MIRAIVKVFQKIDYYVAVVGMWFVAVMMLLTTTDVISRTLFDKPISSAFELSQYMLVIVLLCSIGYVQQKKENVRVSFFFDKFHYLAQSIAEIIFTAVGLTIFALMVWQGWLGTLQAKAEGTYSDILFIPTYPFEFFIAIGAFFASGELLIILITTVKKLITGEYKTAGVDKGGLA